MPIGFDLTILALMPAPFPHTFPLPVPFIIGTLTTLFPLRVSVAGAGGGVCNLGLVAWAGGGQAGCRGPTISATLDLSSMIVCPWASEILLSWDVVCPWSIIF